MLYVMNTTVVPSGCDGIWEAIAIPLESAKLNLQEFSGGSLPWGITPLQP